MPREIHDYNPISYLANAIKIGVDEFQSRKSKILSGTSFVQKLQEVENRQYVESLQKIEELTKRYRDWLDYLHGCFLALVQKFEGEKLTPLTVSKLNLSLFTETVFSLNTSTLSKETQIVEISPMEQLMNNVNEMQARLYKDCGANRDFEEYYANIMKEKAFENTKRNSTGPKPETVPVNPKPPTASPFQSEHLFVPFCRGKLLAKWRTDNSELDKVILNRPVNFTNVTVTVILPDGNMMCCGGRESDENRALIVNTSSGQVTMLPDMKTPRGNPGIIYVDGVTFVFGGFNSQNDEHNTGEKFSLQQNAWTPLKNHMANSRFQFTPAAFQKTVYLAGGWHTSSVEAFDTTTEVFSTLPIVLPKEFGTTAFVYNNELVIAQDKKLLCWPLESRTGDFQTHKIDIGTKDSNVVVQISGTKAYFTHETRNKCDVQMVDLQTWDASEVANLSAGGKEPCPVS